MLLKPEKERRQEIKYQKLHQDQVNLADSGTSSAIENGEVVTIGNGDCDYSSWKRFVVRQVISLGKEFCHRTGDDPDTLSNDICDEDEDSDFWKDEANYFNRMEGKD